MMVRPDGHLSRRGRLARTAIGIAVMASALAFAPRALAAGAGDGSHVPVLADTYTVAAGETLWEIAAAVAPGQSTDATVALIMELNGLSSASLRAGEQILVPVAPTAIAAP